jgi:hypothetical protein
MVMTFLPCLRDFFPNPFVLADSRFNPTVNKSKSVRPGEAMDILGFAY